MGVWGSDFLRHLYKSWFKAFFFFPLLVYLSTKWNESYICEFYFTTSFFISAIVSKEFASGSYGKWSKQPSILAGWSSKAGWRLLKGQFHSGIILPPRCVPKPPFSWISLLYLLLADHFSRTSGVHGRGENLLRLLGHSRWFSSYSGLPQVWVPSLISRLCFSSGSLQGEKEK